MCVTSHRNAGRRSNSWRMQPVWKWWVCTGCSAQTEGLYLTTPDRDVRLRTSNYLEQLARLCCDLGGGVMVLGSPAQRNLLEGVSHDEAMKYAADVISAALPALEQWGVTLAVEPLGPAEGDFLNSAEQAIRLIHMVDSPRVRLHLDVKAMSTEAQPIPDVIRQSAPYLAHFHANDPNKRGPGMGKVDFIPIFQALRDIQYHGWVSVEVFDYQPGVESLAGDSIRYMQQCLEQLG